jgi:hypothetical protein
VITLRRGGVARALLYSHFRPPMAQFRQMGFASSHFTRRVLQVLHPVRTLDVLSRVLLGERSSPRVMMNDAAAKHRLATQRTAGINNSKTCRDRGGASIG